MVDLNAQWIKPDWPAPARVRAFMTTRSGGVSSGPWGGSSGKGGLNLGLNCGDDPAAVRGNRARLAACLPGQPRWLKLVHGSTVVRADTIDQQTNADAAFSDHDETVCCVTVADCVPVLLCDRHGRAVAAAHAGWRGLADGVIENAVHALRTCLDDPSAALMAWLGPAIGPEAFVVGAEVLEAMQRRLPRAHRAFCDHVTTLSSGRMQCDLFALATMALNAVQVHEVYGAGISTHADPERFYSYRRDRVTGRHAALIWLSDNANS